MVVLHLFVGIFVSLSLHNHSYACLYCLSCIRMIELPKRNVNSFFKQMLWPLGLCPVGPSSNPPMAGSHNTEQVKSLLLLLQLLLLLLLWLLLLLLYEQSMNNLLSFLYAEFSKVQVMVTDLS